ncbi:class II peroxidase [Cucurbitaria berberidis CBS 394.84]|uniref:Peroxidase n=1 Tax=Cucurbitaria berberidis CBS 394.84 TaxID=1168544 RepID=A0A9P4GFZ2_9PLEO|nr:class II peroxidase [Cucurbitaria berberidis CBS 394.84]KAF1844860.1 class II peroxidase [Cucurbitaria berberidis CBS 394.84]
MYIRSIFVTTLAATSTARALNLAEGANSAAGSSKRALGSVVNWTRGIFNRQTTCPAVWSEISTNLTAQFLADGQCTDAARAAIRSAFHDCFNGACDGSLILANECSNSENAGLSQLCGNLANIANQAKVGVADLIQFAAAHAIKTCPGGPTVPVKIGRKDSSTANALGVLPAHNSGGDDLVKLFASKGFTPTDLAALIGAHTTAKQRFADPSKAGASLDSTVGTWDTKFYSETKSGKAPFTLQADKNIAENSQTSAPFSNFASSKGAWDAAFVSAMTKMSMLGVDGSNLIDCTGALPGGSRKREIKNSNIFDRLKW